jgi:hypothetical protein
MAYNILILGASYGSLVVPENHIRPQRWCNPHRTGVVTTPAMAAGVTDRLWSLEELVERIPVGDCYGE